MILIYKLFHTNVRDTDTRQSERGADFGYLVLEDNADVVAS